MASSRFKRHTIVLASSSPRRKKLLSELQSPFKVMASSIPERQKRGENAFGMVKRLAVQKARSVAAKLKFKPSLVIGADTVVVLNGKIFGKPRSPSHAVQMLMKLSGRVHRVYTGVAVVNSTTMAAVSAVDFSKVKFRQITFEEARRIGRKNLDKSGSYASQDKKDNLVQKIVGDPQTVVGLPIRVVNNLLNRLVVR